MKRAGRHKPKAPPETPPCPTCPKYKLCPEPTEFGFGLEPGNVLAARLYYKAASEQRVGAFSAIPLLATIRAADALAVLDLYDDLFANPHAKRNCFEKIMIIGDIATKMQADKEEKIRKDNERNKPK